jgi:hypothetical protein
MARGHEGPPPIGQELIIPALAVGFTAYYFWTVQELAWEAKANGVVIGAILLGLVAILVARVAWRAMRREVSLRVTLGGEWPVDRMRLGLMAIMVVFLLALPLLGTTIALTLMLFAAMWLLGSRHWPTLIGASVGTALLVWATLIVGLGTRFPAGPFEDAMALLLGFGAD